MSFIKADSLYRITGPHPDQGGFDAVPGLLAEIGWEDGVVMIRRVIIPPQSANYIRIPILYVDLERKLRSGAYAALEQAKSGGRAD